MLRLLLSSLTASTLCVGLSAQEFSGNGVKGAFEQISAPVLAVVEIAEDGYVFRGYTIDYKGKQVMVSTVVGDGDFKVGDTISVMVNKMEMPNRDKPIRALSFMVMPDTAKLMEGADPKLLKALKADEPDAGKAPAADKEPSAGKKEF